MSLRVLVVDDTAVFRRIVCEALLRIPGVEVAGTAANGRLALGRIEALKPDLITLDLEMPEMNGLEVLEAMPRCSAPPGVLMVSGRTTRGSELTVRALELGAFDFVAKPEGGSPESNLGKLRDLLAPRIEAFCRQREIRDILSAVQRRPAASAQEPLRLQSKAATNAEQQSLSSKRLNRVAAPPIVLIGVSTGGPAALAEVLPALPANFSAPILVVQHMPPLFTGALARSLQAKSKIRIKEAEEGETVVPGCAYLAPGGKHMVAAASLAGKLLLHLNGDPPEQGCRPAADVLFRSVAHHFPGRSVSVIMTGMGSDGTEGLRHLKRSGAISIAQDEASCTVFGMPREAIRAGLADHVVPLSMIATEIIRHVREAK